jgi:F-type H+-transporting ATPase subunit delta
MARPTSAARRYAEAAFELALRDGALDAWGEGLSIAAGIMGDPEAARIVDNPAVPLVDREALLGRLLAGRVHGKVLNLATILTRRNRLELLPAISAQYNQLLNRRRGVAEATVTSAAPLSSDETNALRAHVEAMTGSTVELKSAVDPALIGGLTLRVGDRLLDASIRGRLERLRDQLVTGARS